MRAHPPAGLPPSFASPGTLYLARRNIRNGYLLKLPPMPAVVNIERRLSADVFPNLPPRGNPLERSPNAVQRHARMTNAGADEIVIVDTFLDCEFPGAVAKSLGWDLDCVRALCNTASRPYALLQLAQALVRLQAHIRRLLARKLVMQTLQSEGSLLALHCTIQGRSGWYEMLSADDLFKKRMVLAYDITSGDEWVRMEGPVRRSEYDQALRIFRKYLKYNVHRRAGRGRVGTGEPRAGATDGAKKAREDLRAGLRILRAVVLLQANGRRLLCRRCWSTVHTVCHRIFQLYIHRTTIIQLPIYQLTPPQLLISATLYIGQGADVAAAEGWRSNVSHPRHHHGPEWRL
jgi:hypothetical protein